MSELIDIIRTSLATAMIGTVGATAAFVIVELIRRHT